MIEYVDLFTPRSVTKDLAVQQLRSTLQRPYLISDDRLKVHPMRSSAREYLPPVLRESVLRRRRRMMDAIAAGKT